MALDFSSFEVDCRSMGGLFQQLSHEMKVVTCLCISFNLNNKLINSLNFDFNELLVKPHNDDTFGKFLRSPETPELCVTCSAILWAKTAAKKTVT